MGEFSPPPPPFSELLFNHADTQTSNTSTRFWLYYIITKIYPPPPHFKILDPRLSLSYTLTLNEVEAEYFSGRARD